MLSRLAEAAMADGWRSRYMAPFYALAISFVLVLLLGQTLQKPADGDSEPPPTTPSSKPQPSLGIRFSDAKQFPVSYAIVVWGDDKELVEDRKKLQELRPDEPVTVCGALLSGWTAPQATRTPDRKLVCWGPHEPEPGEYVVLSVREDR